MAYQIVFKSSEFSKKDLDIIRSHVAEQTLNNIQSHSHISQMIAKQKNENKIMKNNPQIENKEMEKFTIDVNK